jgi:hypothetical protein
VTKIQAGTGAVVGTYSIGGGLPAALAFDGTNILVGNSGIVTKLLASTGAVVSTYSVGGSGLAFDGRNIWAVSPGSSNNVTRIPD